MNTGRWADPATVRSSTRCGDRVWSGERQYIMIQATLLSCGARARLHSTNRPELPSAGGLLPDISDSRYPPSWRQRLCLSDVTVASKKYCSSSTWRCWRGCAHRLRAPLKLYCRGALRRSLPGLAGYSATGTINLDRDVDAFGAGTSTTTSGEPTFTLAAAASIRWSPHPLHGSLFHEPARNSAAR